MHKITRAAIAIYTSSIPAPSMLLFCMGAKALDWAKMVGAKRWSQVWRVRMVPEQILIKSSAFKMRFWHQEMITGSGKFDIGFTSGQFVVGGITMHLAEVSSMPLASFHMHSDLVSSFFAWNDHGPGSNHLLFRLSVSLILPRQMVVALYGGNGARGLPGLYGGRFHCRYRNPTS